MKLNILIGGKAGQGINKVSEIVSNILANQGYFTFNYRDYPSLIRGGHNFNILCVSDKRVGSIESKIDIIAPLDEKTNQIHKNILKKDSIIINYEKFKNHGKNINIAVAGALTKILGIDREKLIEEIKKHFDNKGAIEAAERGYNSEKEKFALKKLNNKIIIMTGSKAVAQGAINSKIDLYFGYPMTPATALMNELASHQLVNNFIAFQPESEIGGINQALGAAFTGAKTMIGTSGGGFDLMTEALSLQGQTEIPLVVYLASRPGPSTGMPTYSTQADLDVALRAGHGEFPRIVIAPGDPNEAIEKTNEAFYLSNKLNALSIILADKHLAENEFSTDKKPNEILKITKNQNKKYPGEEITKVNSYEHDKFGNTIELPELTKQNADNRIKKYNEIKKECAKFEMIKVYGNKNSKNIIISWGSNKTAILDALEEIDLDWKFIHVIYIKPMSDKIKEEMLKAKKIILIESNSTGQLGRIIREKTGIKIEKENRILKYDGRPFYSDELKTEIAKRLK